MTKSATASLELRLAARILIELHKRSIPEKYRYVLADLFRVHPSAMKWGLTLNSEILDLDDRGVIFWYISETIYRDVSNQELMSPTQCIARLNNSFTSFITQYGIAQNAAEPVWPGGPSRSQVADRIRTALLPGNERNANLGFAALLGIVANLDISFQRVFIAKLMAQVSQESRLLERMNNFADILAGISTRIIRLAEYALFFGFIVYVITNERTIFRTPLLMAISIFVCLIIIVLPSKDVGSITAQLMRSLLHYIGNIFALRKERFLPEPKISASLNKWSEISVKSKYVDPKGLRKLNVFIQEFRTSSHKRDFGARFFENIGIICNNDESIFEYLLKVDDEFPWADIALISSVINVRTETIRVALHLLGRHDLNSAVRDRIFVWLCAISGLYGSSTSSYSDKLRSPYGPD